MKLLTKTGRLTSYGFACGYIEKKVVDFIQTTLWHEGGPCYHVRQHDFFTHKRMFWEVFESLHEARNFFNRQKGQLITRNMDDIGK